MRRLKLIVPALLTLVASATVAAPAAWADAPPPNWTNSRVLSCDGHDVDTYLAPAGFGTPFNVVGSADVTIPVHVQVTWPNGVTRVTMDKPGFMMNDQPTVHCTYTDPANLYIDFIGIRV